MNNKNRIFNLGLIAVLLPHLFCCVLPIGLVLLGLIAPADEHWHIIPHDLELWVFIFSGLMLVLSWVIVMHKCSCDCDKCETPHPHRTQKIILLIATGIFITGIVIHFLCHQGP